MASRKRRGVTFGTVFMLVLTAVVLLAYSLIMLRLSGDGKVDWSRLRMQPVSLEETVVPVPEA